MAVAQDLATAPARIAVLSDAVAAPDLASSLTAIVAAGGEGVEITAGPGGHLDPTRKDAARTTAALVARSGVVACGLAATGALPVGAPGLTAVVELAATLGLPFVRVFAPPWTGAGDLDAELAATAGALANLAAAGRGDVRVLVEPAEGTLVSSPELARRLLAGLGPAVGVVYDPANLVADGPLQPSLAVAVLGDLLAHVHVKNRVAAWDGAAWGTRYAPLLDGLVDWPLTFRALRLAGYAGWLTIDHPSDGPAALGGDIEDLRRIVAATPAASRAAPDGPPRQRGRT